MKKDNYKPPRKIKAPAPAGKLQPMVRKMQVLEGGHWHDVLTRARSDDGLRRVYRDLCRDNIENRKNGIPVVSGMRIVTIHFEWLGNLPRSKSNAGLCLPQSPEKGLK